MINLNNSSHSDLHNEGLELAESVSTDYPA